MTDVTDTSGATFMVGTVAFRCVDIIGTFTPLYECNRCTAVVTDPERHLARATCGDDIAGMRELCRAAADFLTANHGKTLDLSESDASLNDLVARYGSKRAVGRMGFSENLRVDNRSAQSSESVDRPDPTRSTWTGPLW